MSTLELVKNGRVGVLSTMFLIHNMSSIFTKFEQQGLKKNNEKKKQKKQKNKKNEQPWTLTYTLILQTMSSLVSSFFLVRTN
jgi:hypothetical protein